jgi:hypothetical protein
VAVVIIVVVAVAIIVVVAVAIIVVVAVVHIRNGFGGLVVSMLASGTQVRGFKPGRSRRIFRAKKSLACLPSEGKQSRRSHVADLRHVKEPYNYRGSRSCRLNLIGHFSPIVPSLANRGLSRRLMWSASGDEGGTKAGLVQ